jgi:hypothetical protein
MGGVYHELLHVVQVGRGIRLRLPTVGRSLLGTLRCL